MQTFSPAPHPLLGVGYVPAGQALNAVHGPDVTPFMRERRGQKVGNLLKPRHP